MFVYEARFGIKGNNAHAPRYPPRPAVVAEAFEKDCALKGTSRVFIRAVSCLEERRNCESERSLPYTLPRRGGKTYVHGFFSFRRTRERFAREKRKFADSRARICIRCRRGEEFLPARLGCKARKAGRG